MKPLSTSVRHLADKRMAAAWLVVGCIAVIGLVVVSARAPRLASAKPKEASTKQPKLVIRVSPLSLRSNIRRDAGLPPDRLHAALTEVAQQDFLRWNQLIHGLRLWGPEAEGLGKWTGKKMLAVVCSAEQAQKVFGAAPHVFNRNGLHFAQLDNGGEKHLDETVSVLAEIGVHSDYPVSIFGYKTTVSEAVRAAASNVVLDQTLDFSAVVFAHYLPPQSAWTNKFGERISFDDVCQRLCDQPLGTGNCHGCHAMYALAMILGADGQHEVLSEAVRQKARSRLLQAAGLLRKTQLDDGCWGPQWFDEAQATSSEDLDGVLAVTGHSLEWLAVAPQDLLEDPEMISRGCEGLLARLLNAPPGSLRNNYNAYTHAASALRMWNPQAGMVAKSGR